MLVNSLGLLRMPNRATIAWGRARRSASQIAHSTKALEKMSAPFPLRKRSITNFLNLGSPAISAGHRPQPSQDSSRREAMISSVARMLLGALFSSARNLLRNGLSAAYPKEEATIGERWESVPPS